MVVFKQTTELLALGTGMRPNVLAYVIRLQSTGSSCVFVSDQTGQTRQRGRAPRGERVRGEGRGM